MPARPASLEPSVALWARLRGCSLLALLPDAEFEALRPALEWLQLEGGEALFEQGDPGDSLYLLVHGRLLVTHRAPGAAPRAISEVAAGESVGDLAVLTDEPRSASVRALRDSLLVRLPRERVGALLERNPGAVMALNRVIIDRLRRRSNPAEPTRAVSTIAVVAIDGGAPIAAFAEALRGALAERGPTVHLTRQALTEALGPGPLDDARVLPLVDAAEARGRFVVLEADAADAAWTRRCARQADVVLLVARAEASPGAPAEVLELLRGGGEPAGRRAELVLLHPGTLSRPSGTRRWLEAVPVRRHHHLRLAVPADARRLVRFLDGRAVALVLGGGAVRGAAHLGVLRALDEAGVEVDGLYGTSMGAIMAGQGAIGDGWAAVHRRARPLFLGRSIFDFTVPLLSMTSGQRFDEALQAAFGEVEIADLWLPFRCVSTNLTRAEKRVHDRGPAWRAARASSSLPGVFPPVETPEGDLLVDGALLDNLPVELARAETGGGRTIAVNVIAAHEHSIRATAGGAGAVRAVLDRLRQRPGAGPTILDVLMRSVFLGTVSEAQRVQPLLDLYLEPPVGEFGFLDARPFDAIVEAGYRHARERLAAWPERPR